MVVTSVTGHIMEMEYPSEYSSWQSCDPIVLFDAPVNKFVTKEKTDLKIQLELEARRANWLVLWLDCDREGENIAYEVISICETVNPRLRILRARFSALIPR
jgi:DNA topoisomerase-3